MADLAIIYDTSTGRVSIKKLAAAQIESLDAAVITSGLIPVARISGLPHANLALSGMVDAHDIISLDAAKATSGLIPHARVSGLPYANLALAASLVSGDIKSGQIGTFHVAANAIVSGLVASGGLAPLTSGKIWVGTTGDVPTEVNKPAAGATLTVAETEVFSGTSPTSWTDLDLSGTIGSQATLVILKVFNGHAASDLTFAVRKNGDTDEFYFSGYNCGAAIGEIKAQYFAVFVVATDTSGKIEWISSAAADNSTVDIIGYIK